MAAPDPRRPRNPQPREVAAAVLAESAWRSAQTAHEDAVDALFAERAERAVAGRHHPVEDFLFRYYPVRRSRLRRWHPGIGIVLTGAAEFATRKGYAPAPHFGPDAFQADPATFTHGDLAHRGDHVRSVATRLRAIESRPARLNCFGLHEWAMVHRLAQTEVRHAAQPLRVDSDTIARTIDQVGLTCSHFDAFRFFTPAAVPLNSVFLTSANRNGFEQPGCLHNTMDLYRWAVELQPLTSSALVMSCFALARDARAVDMRASPYDLRDLGYRPIRIETTDGRRQYASEQRAISTRAAPLRRALLNILSGALDATGDPAAI